MHSNNVIINRLFGFFAIINPGSSLSSDTSTYITTGYASRFSKIRSKLDGNLHMTCQQTVVLKHSTWANIKNLLKNVDYDL